MVSKCKYPNNRGIDWSHCVAIRKTRIIHSASKESHQQRQHPRQKESNVVWPLLSRDRGRFSALIGTNKQYRGAQRPLIPVDSPHVSIQRTTVLRFPDAPRSEIYPSIRQKEMSVPGIHAATAVGVSVPPPKKKEKRSPNIYLSTSIHGYGSHALPPRFPRTEVGGR